MSRPEPGAEDPAQLSSLDSLLSLGDKEPVAGEDPDPADTGAGSGARVDAGAGAGSGGGIDAGAGGPGPSGRSPASGGVGSEAIGELLEIDVDSVTPNEFQPRRRFDEASMASLTESVKELGVLQPILVRPASDGRFELIAGERRWRAARRAGLLRVPAVVRTTDDVSSLEQAIVENLHRQDLNALEEAAAYRQLVDDFGLTQDEVAVRVGKSRSSVSNTLRLFQLPAAIQRLVSGGQLSAGHARAIHGLADPQAQLGLAQKIVEEDLSVRAAENAAKAFAPGGSGGPGGGSSAGEGRRGSKSASALEVERLLEDRLATHVEVVESAGSGRIVIRYADDEDLERLFRLLTD